MLASSPMTTHQYFQPDQLGLLVTYPSDDDEFDLNAAVPRLIGTANNLLGEIGVELRRSQIPEIIFPAPPKGFEPVPKINREERPPLTTAFSLVFLDVAGTNGNPAALIEVAQHLERMDLNEAAPGLEVPRGSVFLNWLTSAVANVPIGSGGPGTRPSRFEGDPVQLTELASNPPEFLDLMNLPGSDNPDIKVYILDTAWPKAKLRRLAKQVTSKGPGHSLLERLLGNGKRLTKVENMPPEHASRLSQVFVKDHDYLMCDHGLFVAGVVNTIAPGAQLHLIEVLNPYGVGDLATIGAALSQIATRHHRAPAIINCSFTMSIPYHPLHTWHDEVRLRFAGLTTRQWLQDQGIAFQWICDLLRAQGHQIVAAAGNEGQLSQHPPALFPAAYESVAGVGAAAPQLRKPLEGDRNQRALRVAAPYSNRSDFPTLAGTVTLGGGTDLTCDDNLPLLGIYLGSFPDDPGANTTGWGYWSGTSFATPILSGRLAAQVAGTPAGAAPTAALASARQPPAGAPPPANAPVQPGRILTGATDANEGYLWTRQIIPRPAPMQPPPP